MDELIHKLGLLLVSFVDGGFKYVKSRFSLVKKLSDGAQVITLDILPSSEPGKAKLAMHVHIRLNELENLYGPLHPFLSDKDKKINPTLVVNCDLLFSDKTLTSSLDMNAEALEEIALKYSEAIKKDVLPFFDKYYSIESLVSSFEQEDPSSWISSDRNTRNLILLSAYASKSNWEAFDKVSNEYLEYCDKPHAQAYKPLAESVINGLK